jgi:hypothetical protein
MPGRTQSANATSKKVVAEATFTMQRLRHQALWGATAAAALFLAIVAGRTEIGSQRLVATFASFRAPSQPTPQLSQVAAPRSLEQEVATRQLAQAVRGLTEDRNRILTRLTIIEQSIDDMTGSLGRQIEAVKAASAQAAPPWPDKVPPLLMTPPILSSAIPEQSPAAARAAPRSSSHSTAAAEESPPNEHALPVSPKPETAAAEQSASEPAAVGSSAAYGVDIGGASSIKTLHKRWEEIHSAHGDVLDGLTPTVTLRATSHSERIELRLVVGPFVSAEAAAKVCESLAAFHIFCQPTMFSGRHLALE